MVAKNNNTLWIGAAVAGLLGTLTTLLLPKKERKGWSKQVKEVADQVIGSKAWVDHKDTNRNLFLGSIAGSLVGITTALLLAPKSGNELIKDLSKTFQFIHPNSRSKQAPARSGHSTAAKKARSASRAPASGSRPVNHKKSAISTAKAKAVRAVKRVTSSKKKAPVGKSHAHVKAE